MLKVIPGKLYRIKRGWVGFPQGTVYLVTKATPNDRYHLCDYIVSFLVGMKEIHVIFTRSENETMEHYFSEWLEEVP